MALSSEVIDVIRDEIGVDTDFVNNDSELSGAPAGTLGSLESIYTSDTRGNGHVLVTALIVWRRRLHSLQARSFDASVDGTLLARNQRIKFIERRIKELELLVDTSLAGKNMATQGSTRYQEFVSGGSVSGTLYGGEF